MSAAADTASASVRDEHNSSEVLNGTDPTCVVLTDSVAVAGTALLSGASVPPANSNDERTTVPACAGGDAIMHDAESLLDGSSVVSTSTPVLLRADSVTGERTAVGGTDVITDAPTVDDAQSSVTPAPSDAGDDRRKDEAHGHGTLPPPPPPGVPANAGMSTSDDTNPDDGRYIVMPVPADGPVVSFRHSKLGDPALVWAYNSPAGLLGYVCRFSVDTDKTFRQRTLWTIAQGGTAWRWKSWPAPRPLYGLDRLAAQPDAVVIVTEGEKAADAATSLWSDRVAIAPPHGAKSPHLTDWTPLSGRCVVIWPDADAPGCDFGDAVAHLVRRAGAADVRVVDVPLTWPKGWDLADSLPEGVTVERLRALLDSATFPAPNAATSTPKTSRSPFQVRDDGVYRAVDTGDDVVWERVCAPLDVRALTRSEHGEDWGRLLVWPDTDGREHSWAMPAELLAAEGAALRAELLRLGLVIQPGATAARWLIEYLMLTLPTARVRCVSRCGWHGSVYVFGDRTFPSTAGGEPVMLQTVQPIDLAARTAGTLIDWQQSIARYCVGNSRFAFSLALAFAAPLLALTGDESGGFHFYGPSSTGKTTALRVAGSVWGGGGDTGWVRAWRTTANGLEAVAAAHSDALLVLDELSQASAREIGDTVYMIANQSGKRRAKGDGTARRTQTWRTLFLSSGEITLAAKMQEVGLESRAGQEVRLTEIPADPGVGLGVFEQLHGFESSAALVQHLAEATTRTYGVPIREYLERLAGCRDEVAQSVALARRKWVTERCPADADGQVQRVAHRFGLVAAAGTLASAFGILPWDEDEASHAAAACFQAWLAARGGIGPAEVAKAIEQVRLFIAQHGASRFARKTDDVLHNRAGFLNFDDKRPEQVKEFLIFPQVWRAEVCRGHDPGSVARALAAAGHLVPCTTGRLDALRRVQGAGQARYYVLRATIAEEREDA